MNRLRVLRESWRMLRSDDRTDTYLAVLILGVVFGPIFYRMWRVYTENRRRLGGYSPETGGIAGGHIDGSYKAMEGVGRTNR